MAGGPLIRSGRFDATSEAPFAFGDADAWRILVTVAGAPHAYLLLADPGPTADPRLTSLSLQRAGEIGRLDEHLAATLEKRLGVPTAVRSRPTCSVVIATHQRPQLLATALEAIASLEPPADEVIVVENGRVDAECEAIARRAGARYVREDRLGHNRARAAGLAQARCELVAFTDDDVLVSRLWLKPLPELFADESVGAATGVAVAHELRTSAQNLREELAGFIPGMQSRRFDWTKLRPVSSGAAGAGANMIFRRALLLELGDAFPPELDGGTPTRSGGDIYALYRVLAAGRRIAFTPDLYAEHRHPAADEALQRTVRSYGIGFTAFLTKVLVQSRELATPLAWMWLVSRLVEAIVSDPLTPRAGVIRLRRAYLAASLLGPPAWIASLRANRPRHDDRAGGVRHGPVAPEPTPVDIPPDVQLVGERSVRERNAVALAAAAANPEALLLFIDPSTSVAYDAPGAHLQRHRGLAGADAIVIGRTVFRSEADSLAAQLSTLWHEDRLDAQAGAAVLTFADVSATNISMGAALFRRLGGFDEQLRGEAAAQDLALRALEAGARLEYEPRAQAHSFAATDTRRMLAALRRSGADHALVARRHPRAAAVLPSTVPPGLLAGFGNPSLVKRLPVEPVCTAGARLACALEWCRLRGTWLRLFRQLARLSYGHGYATAGGPPTREAPELDIDLAGCDPISPPRHAPPLVRLRIGAHRLGTIRPRGGQWGRGVVAQAVESVDAEGWRLLSRLHAPGTSVAAALEPQRLDGTLVVYGPGNRSGDDRHAKALTASGARVARAEGRADQHWDSVAALIAEAPEPRVALTLPGVRANADWLGTALAALSGSRVAAVCGVGVPRNCVPLPTLLISRATAYSLYEELASPPQFAVLSTAVVAELGGLDARAARFGLHGPLLDLLDRALEAGHVVAHQETRGVEPFGSIRPERSRLVWSTAYARGGLLARAAVRRGPLRGAALLASQLVAKPIMQLARALTINESSARSFLGENGGRLAGCAHALITYRRWRDLS